MKISKEKDTVTIKCTVREARLLACASAYASENNYNMAKAAKMDCLARIGLQVASEFNAVSESILTVAPFCENI